MKLLSCCLHDQGCRKNKSLIVMIFFSCCRCVIWTSHIDVDNEVHVNDTELLVCTQPVAEMIEEPLDLDIGNQGAPGDDLDERGARARNLKITTIPWFISHLLQNKQLRVQHVNNLCACYKVSWVCSQNQLKQEDSEAEHTPTKRTVNKLASMGFNRATKVDTVIQLYIISVTT
jgi:hypothetical protein